MRDGSNASRTSEDRADTMGTGSCSNARISSRGRLAAVLILTFAFGPSAWLARLSAQSDAIIVKPTVGIMPPVTVIAVNDSADAQMFPHVSDDLASFSDTHYQDSRLPLSHFRFSTGITSRIPLGSAIADSWPDIDDGRMYVIAPNTLYQITSVGHYGISGIDVLDSGNIRLVWSGVDDSAPESSWNIFATTFWVALTTTPRTCLLYDPALVKKSGSAFPIKLRLCDANGNNLSSPLSLCMR